MTWVIRVLLILGGLLLLLVGGYVANRPAGSSGACLFLVAGLACLALAVLSFFVKVF
ncbi:MAG TPA: hypothetical protein VE989_08925 [Sphingomicrobium sp.]|nr:hypothetical protein [Sphingomicrobium sp.]